MQSTFRVGTATKLLFLLLLFWIAGLNQSFSQHIYVSTSGNDDYPGSREKPIYSLTRARDIARNIRKSNQDKSPIIVIVQSGDYYMTEPLSLQFEDSGLENTPLIFRGEGTTRPVFYGGKKIPKFQINSDSLWTVEIPWIKNKSLPKFEQLYGDRELLVRAQSPDSGYNHPASVRETILFQGNSRTAESANQEIKVSADISLLKDASIDELQNAVISINHHWDNTIKKIASFHPIDSSISIKGRGMKSWNPINTKSSFLIQNLKSALNKPGEWFLADSGTLYYRPRKGDKIDKLILIAPVLEYLIKIDGYNKDSLVQNIQFENISFQGTAFYLPTKGFEPTQSAASVPCAIELNYKNNISFKGCEISNFGAGGIWFRKKCRRGVINSCLLQDLGANAIKIGETNQPKDPEELTSYIVVDNNIIRQGGQVISCASAILLLNASDNIISHNDISDFKYTGISAGWVWGYSKSPSKRNLIEFNNIHHLGWGILSDMGGIYTLGPSEGTSIRNNMVHHIFSAEYGGWGIYTDEGSSGILIENNLVYNCKDSGFHQHYGSKNIIKNNIFAYNFIAQLRTSRVEEHLSFSFTNNIILYNSGELLSSNWDKANIFSDYNCYWDARVREPKFGTKSFKAWQEDGKDVHSIIANPHFKNPNNFDFGFKSAEVLKKIQFIPFDYSKCGVYGSKEWKNEASLPADLLSRFDKLAKQLESSK